MPALVGDAGHLHRLLPGRAADGTGRFLFMPLALSVVFAMLASYLLSRTLVPALARCCCVASTTTHAASRRANGSRRFNRWRDRQFERLRDALRGAAAAALHHRALRPARRGACSSRRVSLGLVVGRRPRLLPVGRRRADEAALPRAARARASRRPRSMVDAVEDGIRRIIPADELETINDNDRHARSPTTSRSSRPTTSASMDAEMLVALKREAPPHRASTRRGSARRARRASSPACSSTSSRPTSSARCSTSVCRRRSTSRSRARDLDAGAATIARKLRDADARGARHRATCASTRCSTTRRCSWTSIAQRAAQLGISERDVANSVLTSLSSSAAGRARTSGSTRENSVNYIVGGADAASPGWPASTTSWRRR